MHEHQSASNVRHKLFLRASTWPLVVRANKIGSVVRAAGALVLGNLWVRAQRSSAVRLGLVRSSWEMSCDDSAWRFVLLDPLFKHLDVVKFGRAVTAATMAHSRDHEQT